MSQKSKINQEQQKSKKKNHQTIWSSAHILLQITLVNESNQSEQRWEIEHAVISGEHHDLLLTHPGHRKGHVRADTG